MNEIFDKLVKNRIEQFINDYNNLSRQIFLDADGKLIHPGEFGVYREKIIKNFLEPFLPQRLAIGDGFIITSKNRISTQCDIIIYDREHTPVIENSEQKFFPIECVAGVIESKSKLTKKTLKNALIKLAKIKELKEDIVDAPYVFKDFKSKDSFNVKMHPRDQMATFLICESIEGNIENEWDKLCREIYSGIDKSNYHNMILCLEKHCFLYNDGERPIYYAYFEYFKENFRNIYISPSEMGYSREHILLFLNYFFMVISSVSIMYLEITKYLGVSRLRKET